MSYHRRRFGDDDYHDPWEYEEEAEASSGPTEEATETIAGQDDTGAVTVNVTPEADVVSVKLDAGWKNTVDPRSLHASVLSAANTATAQALAKQVEQMEDPSAVATSQPGAPTAGAGTTDETPLTTEDTIRLVDAVTTDLDQFMSQLSTAIAHPASAESSGGHVSGSGKQGQVLEISIDPYWANAARNAEIENELTDCLKRIQSKSSLGELANGPQSKNIAELQALASDPQTLLRRVGLTPPSSTDQRTE